MKIEPGLYCTETSLHTDRNGTFRPQKSFCFLTLLIADRNNIFLPLSQKNSISFYLADAFSSPLFSSSLSTLHFPFSPFLLLTCHPDSHDLCASLIPFKSYLMCIQTSSYKVHTWKQLITHVSVIAECMHTVHCKHTVTCCVAYSMCPISVRPQDPKYFNSCQLPALEGLRLAFIMKQSHQHYNTAFSSLNSTTWGKWG